MFYLYTIFTKAYGRWVANKCVRTLKRVQDGVSMVALVFSIFCTFRRRYYGANPLCCVIFPFPRRCFALRCNFPGSLRFLWPSRSIVAASGDCKTSVKETEKFEAFENRVTGSICSREILQFVQERDNCLLLLLNLLIIIGKYYFYLYFCETNISTTYECARWFEMFVKVYEKVKNQ